MQTSGDLTHRRSEQIGPQFVRRHSGQAGDGADLFGWHAALAAPVADCGLRRKPEPLAQRLGAASRSDGTFQPGAWGVGCFHGADSASTMHRPSSAEMHRQPATVDAPFPPMEQLILTPSDHKKAMGARMRRVIKVLGESQVEVAKTIKVSKENLGNWLRGDSYPSMHPLYKFCRIFGVTPDWLILGDPSGLRSDIRDRLLSLEQEPERPSAKDRRERETS
jgi:transcriptional regulator with XRE-family HTH domain